jgi:hypothetical protein
LDLTTAPTPPEKQKPFHAPKGKEFAAAPPEFGITHRSQGNLCVGVQTFLTDRQKITTINFSLKAERQIY